MHRYSKSSIQRTLERCRARENVTRKRARPRKWAWDQIGENVIGEKWIWDETVRQIVRPSLPSPHSPTWGASMLIRGSERVTPHFCLSLYLHRQANAIVCRQTEVFAPPLLERFTTISIFGVLQVGDDDLGKGMPRINWVMQIVEKKTQTDRISADRVAEEIRSALISWLSQKHRSVINFKRELQYLTRMDGIAFLKDSARLAHNVY